MARRAASRTQADIARAIRAAKQAGADRVEFRADGTIVFPLSPGANLAPEPQGAVDDESKIVL
jgi:hypothetical protein